MQRLSDIGEDALIQRLVKDLPLDASVVAGPGDDCAVVNVSTGRQWLLKADAVVEDVHFLREAEPRLIGRKALARVVSDIGAMGGEPKHALITLVLPPELEVRYVEALYKGMRALAEEFGVSIVGGETVRGPKLMISVALTGEVEAGRAVMRSTAAEGDAILVTGRLGGSLRGHHLTFQPRVREARWLAEHHRPSAMMDLSDGLAKDLPRLAAASGLGFEIDPALLPCNEGCTPAEAWGDGEDYELLLTLPEPVLPEALEHWKKAFPGVLLTKIGRMAAEGQGSAPDLAPKGWDHFAT